MRYVGDAGLTDKRRVVVDTMNRWLHLQLQDDGYRVTGGHMAPVFEHAACSLDAWPTPRLENGFEFWPGGGCRRRRRPMGKPHAVQRVADVDTAPFNARPADRSHAHFPRKVNAGFMQILARDCTALGACKERDAGETLIRAPAPVRWWWWASAGWLDAAVEAQTRGGLVAHWSGLVARTRS